jgi:transposase
MSIVMLGIDIAKNVFALHGLNEAGRVDIKRPTVVRGKLRPRCSSSGLGGAQFRHEQ